MKDEKEFKPYISAEKSPKEFTVSSIVLGIILAVVFGAANAYLGLRVGMTVSASIPAAVISMGILRVLFRRESILENNLVQTIGSAGESVAAGAIFTIPALFLWAEEGKSAFPSLTEVMIISLLGGILGVLFMVPLRRALVVKEHRNLPYPEGSACAEVLLAGETGGEKARTVFAGLGIAGIYKFIVDGVKAFPSQIHFEITKLGGGFGIDALPALTGVGYICGLRIASYMFAGGILAWLGLIPLVKLFGDAEVAAMDSFSIWSGTIKYVGAGAVAAGGIISLIKSMPMIVQTFFKLGSGYERGNGEKAVKRTERDLPMKLILFAILIISILIWLLPVIPVNLLGAAIIVIFGFVFATVSSRLVGLVGSSNNPVSGMTIATLIIAAIAFKWSGYSGVSGMVSVIATASIICIVTAVAGDTSQDLKTGYLLGATPARQQIGEVIGVIASSVTIGGVLYLLSKAWGYGSESLPAPQATLMKMIVEGVMEGNLPWVLVFVGAFLAIAMEIMRIPVLPFAVGLYLPVHLSAGIMVGGIVREIVKKRRGGETAGILYSSGMIAGEGLIGILLAIFAISGFEPDIGMPLGQWGTVIFFLVLIALFFYFSRREQGES